MHKKARDTYKNRAYRYRVYLDESPSFTTLPHTVKEEAFGMRDLWNQLVDLWEQNGEEYRNILLDLETVRQKTDQCNAARAVWETARTATKQARSRYRTKTGDQVQPFIDTQKEKAEILKGIAAELKAARLIAKALLQPQLKALTDAFWERVNQATKDTPVQWGNHEVVTQGFQACLTRFFRGTGGAPRKKTGYMSTICFRQRFTGGGMPIQKLFRDVQAEPRTRLINRLWVDHRPPAAAFAKGRSDLTKRRLACIPGGFAVASATLPFRILLHRDLPIGAFIKSATLVGERCQREYYARDIGFYQHKWRYHLVFTLEIPPEVFHRIPANNRPTAAIDLGWRILNDRIRFGYLVDSTGEQQGLFLPRYILDDWRFCKEMQEKASRSVDDIKAQILESAWYTEQDWKTTLPEEQHKYVEALPMSKGPGLLWRFLKWEVDGLMHGQRMRQWAEQWSRWDGYRQGVHGRLTRSRNHFYRELTNTLCQRYSSIAIEELALDELATRESDQAAIELSQQYRQLTGLSFFISYLGQSAERWSTEIPKKNPARTTIECHWCGEIMENTGALVLECSNGHRTDQDYNAAKNINIALLAAVGQTEHVQ